MQSFKSKAQLGEAERLQEEGRILYKKGACQGAVAKFTEAINMDTPRTVRILDNRAATYEKLASLAKSNSNAQEMTDLLKKALKDATLMIRKETEEPRGYLRAAKILCSMNDLDQALKIDKYGLKKCPASHPDYALLEGQHAKVLKLRADQVQGNTRRLVDPVTVLPLELLEMVMKLIPFRTLVRCQLVSPGWHSVISSNHPFWSVLDFSAAKSPVKPATVKSYLKMSKYGITKAVLNRVAGLNGELISLVVRKCKDLSYLRIVDGSISASLNDVSEFALNLTTLILNCETSLEALKRLIRPECHIQHLEVYHLAQLIDNRPLTRWTTKPCPSFKKICIDTRNVTVDKPPAFREIGLQQLLDILPNVVEFMVIHVNYKNHTNDLDLSKNEKLETFVYKQSRMDTPQYPIFPSSLLHLDLEGSFLNSFRLVVQVAIPYLSDLVSLNVADTNITDVSVTEFMMWSWTTLKRLDVSHATRLDIGMFERSQAVREGLGELEDLGLENYFDVDNDFLKTLPRFSKLKTIRLSSTRVNGGGVLWLLNEYKSKVTGLEEIIIQQNGIDPVLVEKAKVMGVRLDVKTSNGDAGKKKLKIVGYADRFPIYS